MARAQLIPAGPLFLGFAFQFFGMGIVLVLSANYYTVLASRPKMPRVPSRYCGFFLVTSALLFNLAQTAVDMHRGWQVGPLPIITCPHADRRCSRRTS
jgi:hypothetical protein